MKNSIKELVLTAVAKTIKGTTFVGVRNYTNSQGEVSNQTVLVGINYENVLIHDFNALKEKQIEIIETFEKDYKKEVVLKAYENLYNSLEKRHSDEQIKEQLRLQGDATIKASDAQSDAYIHLAKGVKKAVETNEIHIFGLVINKTILEAVEYKTVNSRELTIVQNKIKKFCKFKQDKFKTFKFSEGSIKLQGIEI